MADHEKYKWSHAPRFEWVLEEIERVENLRRSDDRSPRILEVGAHPFVFTERLVSEFPGAEIYCIGHDGNEPEIQTVAGKEVEIRYCNVEQDDWPFEDEQFDIVTMMAIIEHLLDPLSALWQARRVLSWDGTFLLTVPNAVSLVSRIRTLRGENPFDGYPLESRYNRHNHEYTKEEIEDLFPSAGLLPSKIEMLNERRIWTLPRLAQYASAPFPNFRDQIAVSAQKSEPADKLPNVYRQGVTESTETHPLKE